MKAFMQNINTSIIEQLPKYPTDGIGITMVPQCTTQLLLLLKFD